MAFLKTLFDGNEREVVRLRKTADRINALEPATAALSDEQLAAKTVAFRERLAQGETVDALLVEAFAVVREAGKRVLGMRHFDVQLMGGQALHEGSVAEMRTGEGKTLVATLPVYLNALSGEGVHVVTVNDYLAKRDAEWMGPLYRALGLTVGIIQHDPIPPRGANSTTATSPTSPTTKSVSTTCAITWLGASIRWCSANCTTRSSTKSTRSWSTKRVRR